MILFSLLFAFFVINANAIYEDQVNVLDWLQKFTGKIKFSKLKFDGATPKNYYVGSNLNVISSINLKDGSIVWRQVLEEGGLLTSFELCGNRLFSISSKQGTKLRAWDAKFGGILWEVLIDSSESSSGDIWCNEYIGILVAAYDHGVDTYSLLTGEKLSSDKNVNLNSPHQINIISRKTEPNLTISVVEQYLNKDGHHITDTHELSNIIIKTYPISSSGLQSTSMVMNNHTVQSSTYSQQLCNVFGLHSISSDGVIVCLSSELGSKGSFLRFSSVSSLLNWKAVTIKSVFTNMIKLTDIYFLLTSSSLETTAGALYHLDSSGIPVMKYIVSNAMIGCLGVLNDRSYLFTLHHNFSQDFKNLALNIYDLESGELSKELVPRHFTLAGHHGKIESMSVIMFTDASGAPSFRLILHTEDNAVQLIWQNGKQQWIREESLANVVAVEVVDLPVSEFQAKIEEEFSHASNNIVEMFIQRLKTQISQLIVWTKHWISNLPNLFMTLLYSAKLSSSLINRSPSDLAKRRVQSFSSQDSSFNDLTSLPSYSHSFPPRWQFLSDISLHLNNYTGNDNSDVNNNADDDKVNLYKSSLINPKVTWDELLTRDNFNVHKMLIIATSVGKIFGIESERGRIVWDYFVPSAGLLANGKLTLFQQRNLAHFPLPPIMSLLFRSKTTNLPVLFSFNPITGVPSREKGMNLYALKFDIIQTALQPGSISERCDFIRPLLLLRTDLEVEVYPSSCASTHSPFDSLPLYIFTVESEQARLTGYRINSKSSNDNTLKATRVWRMLLSPDSDPDNKHVIVAAASRPSSEHIYSVGRVLGDRSVLYKYLNPNLIAVLTVGGHVNSHTNTLMIYLIDVVAGRILYSAVHRRCSEPISLVHSENWIIYTYYNHKSLRNEATVLELYEPTKLSGELCASHSIPSPWQLFLSNFIPSWLSNPSSQLSVSKNPSDLSFSHFSSLFRASDVDGFCSSTGENSLIPQVLQQSYILNTPPRSGAAAVSITDRGITAKNVILALQKNSLIEIPKSFFDPRRSLDMTPELMEEGVHPYAPVLPFSDQSMITYNQSVMRIRAIRTAPTGLESTGLVFAYGLDLFFTRISPSQTYDLLKEDFDYTAIATVTLGMIIASIICCRLATRRAVLRAWA
ncbi:ER membrane protein complex subunit 1 isoform 1 [Schistosoma japonicum]|uniref:ER membrane protein complex subunit 1 n=1 Tax=Schistosoma japonicum TaxID=6182 RepID=A0A4Z2DJE1_SCHJA|nr:ER membrane protein complex subunit 1 isoform 1 [Schistosoma japonicum]